MIKKHSFLVERYLDRGFIEIPVSDGFSLKKIEYQDKGQIVFHIDNSKPLLDMVLQVHLCNKKQKFPFRKSFKLSHHLPKELEEYDLYGLEKLLERRCHTC